MYVCDSPAAELRQGEILSSLVQYEVDPVTLDVRATTHSYVIIFSQDCDLLRHHTAPQEKKDSILNAVLLLEAEPEEQMKAKSGKSGKEWKVVSQHREFRYHLLPPVAASVDREGLGVPALAVDFRRCFAMSAAEIYRQIGLTSGGVLRRCRLETPFREHFQQRVAAYLQRIALPDETE